MLIESGDMFIRRLELFKALFCSFARSFSDRYKQREKREQGRQLYRRRSRPCPIQARTDAKPSKFSLRKHGHPNN